MEIPSWIVVFAVPAAIFLFLRLLADQQTKKNPDSTDKPNNKKNK